MPRISEERIFNLIGSIYDRTKDPAPGSWQGVYDDIAQLISSGPGGLSLYVERADRFNVVAGTISPDLIHSYSEHYQYVSPFRNQIVKMQGGERFSRIENCTDDVFEKTEIYQDFFRTQDVYEFEHQMLFQSNGLSAGISFSRPKERKFFTPTERNALNLIIPHLKRAFQVYLQMADVRRENRAMTDALSKMPRGVILINRARKVVFANDCAEAIVAAKDGLELDSSNVLRASGSNDTRSMWNALTDIFEPRVVRASNNYGVLQVDRPSGKRGLQLLISPFTGSGFAEYDEEVLGLIFVHDPDMDTYTAIDVLCQMYGLTNAEARLTAILADGRSLNEACEILAITQNTARTHLKRVFSKTDTNRQTELVKLVISGAASIHINNPLSPN